MGALLTVLTLSVLQLGLALHVRNTVLDAAAEGARYAGLAGSDLEAGASRTRELITAAIGDRYASAVTAGRGNWQGQPVAEISVAAPLPMLGLLGFDRALRVTGRAAIEGDDAP